ncbi:MAG: hypothetical protein IJK06_04840 [Clostridia bacterium]|nr:hypothetical protein [Clostridia bacterium]
MKRLVCLLLALVLLPCISALADLDEWEFYTGPDFTIRFPDYMVPYDISAQVTGRPMILLEDPEDTDAEGNPNMQLYIFRADEETWKAWQDASAFPDPYGGFETMQRIPVDEPPVMDEPEEVEMVLTMDMSYALYQSEDGKWQQEVFIFDHPAADDYVVICRFPAGDTLNSDVLHWMIAYMTFFDPETGNSGNLSDSWCPFSLYPDNHYATPFREVVVDEDAEPIWLFAEYPMTNFSLEHLAWSDDMLTVVSAAPLFTADQFTTEEALAIYTYIPDFAPELRVHAVNSEGGEEFWYITDSGEDGSLVLLSGTADGF